MSGHLTDKKRMRPSNNAARERSRVQSLRAAFLDLQRSLPSVPLDTKLSKLDTLVLATAYIFHLTQTLDRPGHEDIDVGGSGSNGSTESDDGFGIDIKAYSTSQRTQQQETALPLTTPFPSCASSEIKGVVNSYTGTFYKSCPHTIQHSKPSGCLFDGGDGTDISETSTGVNVKEAHAPDSDVMTTRKIPPFSGISEICDPCDHPTNQEWKKSRPRRQLKPKLLTERDGSVGILHPVKKWPMRYRLYDKILGRQPSEPTIATIGSWGRKEQKQPHHI